MFGKGRVELLADRTLAELSLDVTKLQPGSHHKVWVKCSRCAEEFRREYRSLHQLHNCPTRRTINGSDHKWCNKCQLFRPVTEFNSNAARYDGLTSLCKTHQSSTPSAARKCGWETNARRTNLKYWMRGIAMRKKNYCEKHGVQYTIDRQFLLDQWQRQSGKCYYSGVLLTFGTKSLSSAWLERLDPVAGYVPSNTVWASKAVNCAKNDATLDDFLSFLVEAEFSRICPVRLECKKLHPDAIVPERKRITDAALDIYTPTPAIIPANGTKLIGTGIALTPPVGWYYSIEARSGLASKGVIPHKGIIDATYTGELGVVLFNLNDAPYEIGKGDRIAQLILHKVTAIDIVMVEEFSPDYKSDRGAGGFGSTGA